MVREGGRAGGGEREGVREGGRERELCRGRGGASMYVYKYREEPLVELESNLANYLCSEVNYS